MKRFLKKDRFQLSMREQEDVWRGIQQQSGRAPGSGRRRLPLFGLTTAVAAVLLVAVWLNDKDAPQMIAEQVQSPRPLNSVRESSGKKDMHKKDMQDAWARLEATKELDFQTVPAEEAQDSPTKGRPPAAEGPRTKSAGKDHSGQPKEVPPPPTPISREPSGLMGQARKPGSGSGNQNAFEEFENVEEALSKQAGILSRDEARPAVRGGRSGDVMMAIDGVAAVPPAESAPEQMARARRLAAEAGAGLQGPGSVTGGTTPPNGEQYELMYFEHAGTNPFVATEEDALSTFAVDVDNASYTVVRNYLNRDALPPRDAVRVEEFVNFSGGGYPAQTEEVFAIHTDGSASRFGQGYRMLRVGLQGMDISETGRKPATLIFVIDVSGSMNRENRLGTVKQSLRILLEQLGEGDRVGIVTYGSRGQVLLEPADLSRRDEILRAIEHLVPSGATNAGEGLELAYDLARRHFAAGSVNRLILCSDGVANMGGTTEAEEMLARVKHSSAEGITLSTVGFGMGNYNDVLMEKLADQGDGNYHYVDSLDEARRVFKQNLTGLLQTIARQVKIQVEFDPEHVRRWRLLGYENRDVADRDFRNDKVDAGEVGAGHQVTALYELKLEDGVEGDARLGTVRVRYQYPAYDTARADKVEEIAHPFTAADLAGGFDKAAAPYRLQAVAAEFAEILRGSFWAKESPLGELRRTAESVADALPRGTEQRDRAEELIRLIRKADQLRQEQEARQHPALQDED